MKKFKLKFTYSTEMVFDYLQDRWLSFQECTETYGSKAANKALFNPGRIVADEEEKRLSIISVERCINF